MSITISNKIRTALKDYALSRGDAYRITRNNELHIKGIMPNTNQYGWYLMGDVGDVLYYNNLLGTPS